MPELSPVVMTLLVALAPVSVVVATLDVSVDAFELVLPRANGYAGRGRLVPSAVFWLPGRTARGSWELDAAVSVVAGAASVVAAFPDSEGGVVLDALVDVALLGGAVLGAAVVAAASPVAGLGVVAFRVVELAASPPDCRSIA